MHRIAALRVPTLPSHPEALLQAAALSPPGSSGRRPFCLSKLLCRWADPLWVLLVPAGILLFCLIG